MNLRVFKKDIEYFIGEFIEDCDLFVLLNPQQGDVREARRALREAQRYSCKAGVVSADAQR